MKNKKLLTKVIALTMVVGISATAFSTNSLANTTSTVSGGSLTGGQVTFSPLSSTLTGSKTTTTANWAISDVIDARGTGSGWNVSMSLTQFKEVDVNGDVVIGGKTLSTNSLKVKTAPTIAKVDPTSSEISTITPVSLDTALDSGTPIKLLSAQADGGMGTFTLGDLGVELTIPANAYAKTYKTVATVTLNTAP